MNHFVDLASGSVGSVGVIAIVVGIVIVVCLIAAFVWGARRKERDQEPPSATAVKNLDRSSTEPPDPNDTPGSGSWATHPNTPGHAPQGPDSPASRQSPGPRGQ
ncbi:DUF6479 family protein [Streptacidiphilus sp. PB12-B1b]|uniref:DUF6479 family protein n=1 Tax=Streptacidiphilus sp. PB12-B1b TaxID=2705012 RepID=UPI001CDD13DE